MDQYFHSFDPEKNYEGVEFRPDRVIQSRELNDVQDWARHNLAAVADAVFANGDLVRGAQIVVNPQTGAVQAEAGAVYLRGAVRGVKPATFTIPVVGIATVGIYLLTRIVTEQEDPTLRNPATGTPSQGKPGAARRQVQPSWGFAGDGQEGEFFPVYTVEDGYLRPKAPPPSLDSVTRALEEYDETSTGGCYIIEGLTVAMAADLATGEQVFTVAEGRARVGGRAYTLPAGRRLVTLAAPDLNVVDSEPHLSTTDGPQRINLGRPPAKGVPEVRITVRRTVTVVHGGFAGVADVLPDASVVDIELVKQGSAEFKKDADFRLTAGQVDWSPSGAEPAPGSSYQVTYLCIVLATVTKVDARGFTVEGAVKGTTILVTYRQQLRRIDRLCINREGSFVWIRGTASAWTPTPPQVPDRMLAIASVYQTWDESRQLINDGDAIVQVGQQNAERRRVDALVVGLAELSLYTSAQGMDAGVKKGLIADSFINDGQRDAGIEQTAAIVRGALQLPITSTVHQLGATLPERMAPAHGYRVVLEQPLRTGSRLVNPYMAFDPVPASVTLTPNVDRWTSVETTWKSAITERLYTGAGAASALTATATAVRTLSEESRPLEYLRATEVRFDLAGWGPGEELASVTFDGLPVAAKPLAGGALKANAAGQLAGTFIVPDKVSAGAKAVVFRGPLGSRGSQTFYGQGTAVLRTQQSVTTETYNRYDVPVYSPVVTGGGAVWGPSGTGSTPPQNTSACSKWLYEGYFDPISQGFMLEDGGQIAGVDLRITAAGGPVVVQIRETVNGLPSEAVVIEARVPRAAINLEGPTRVTWVPTILQARRMYAIVVLCDDATTAVAVAQLGKQDPERGYVTSQPYQVGVLAISSNASAWTPLHDEDLWFRVLAPAYTETERVIELGTADVVAATDLMVLGFAERASAACGVVFEVQFPESMKSEVVRLNDGQIVWLAAPFTGQLKVRARITGDGQLATVLQNGVQLIAGHIESTGTYVSRTVNAAGAGRLRVVYEGDIPGGAAVQVHAQASDSAAWVLVPYLSASTNTQGAREITCELSGLQAAAVRVRLTLTGSTTARPFVRNLRGATL